MTSEKKYHDLLDNLAETIRKGDHKKIERIKEKIEQIENQMYLERVKEKNKNGK